MTIFDRYVARMFLSSYLILLLVGIGIYVVSDILVNLDEYTENANIVGWQVLTFMADYYGYNLPLYFAQLGGFMLAIAAAFTLGNLLRNNELTALIAAGVPLHRLAAPLFLCAALVLAAWAANQEFVLPPIAHKVARTKDDITGKRTELVAKVRDSAGVVATAQQLNLAAGTLERVQFEIPGPDKRAIALIDADRATWNPDAGVWTLERGRQLRLDRETGIDTALRWDPVTSVAYGLTPEQLVLQQRAAWGDLLSLREMNRLVQSESLPNRPAILMARHRRLTEPVIFFVLMALTIPFFLTREPGGVLSAGSKAVVVCGLFMALTFIAHGIIGDGNAALRAWAPILTFGPLAVVLLANVRT